MRSWSGQLFPLALLGSLAALTFWLDSMVSGGPDNARAAPGHTPDAIAENIEMRRFDEYGRLKYRLSAPYLIHYGDDDSAEIQAPRMIAYRPDSPPFTLVAAEGRVISGGETIRLTRDVVATRAATEERPELVARMPDLTIQPDAGLAFTASPVEITQGASWVRGVGARIDNNNATFELQSQVRGQYITVRKQP